MKNVFIRIATSVVAAGVMMGTAHAACKINDDTYSAVKAGMTMADVTAVTGCKVKKGDTTKMDLAGRDMTIWNLGTYPAMMSVTFMDGVVSSKIAMGL